MKYTVKQLQADFPNDDACLAWLVQYLYPSGIICVKCEEKTKHYKVAGRRSYACSRCGNHFYPTAGTIFHKSHVPLTDWFRAIYVMSTNKSGTSARQIQRELGVSYRVAWRMMHKIRSMMDFKGQLTDEVEIDETFIHPNTYKRSSARRRYGRDARRQGEVVFGIVQRGGPVKVMHVRAAGARVLQPLIREHVQPGALIHTDGYLAYRRLPKMGYEHRWTNHERNQYYTPDSYTQNIENVWSHLKRGIKGVYRHIEPGYVQLYANEFAWRYNHRHKPVLFWDLLADVIWQPSFSSGRWSASSLKPF